MPANESESQALKQRMIQVLREPLYVAIEREFSRMLLRENISLSRAEYSKLKWEVVRAIVNSGE
jgi:hypothetical protein